MAKLPDTGFASEEEVLSLFDKDGELRDTPQNVEDDSSAEDSEEQGEDEGGDEQEAEEQEEESEEATEDDSEEESATDEADELDWEAVEPEYREAFKKVETEAKKWEKAHSKLQSQRTKDSQARREEEQTLNQMRGYAQEAQQWNALLAQHPELQKTIEREIAKLRDPFKGAEVPDYLKDDPAFKYVKNTYEPHIRRLEERIEQLTQKTGVVDKWESQHKDAEARTRLDGLLDQGNDRFKEMFGRDMTNEDKKQVLAYMIENEYFKNGKVAVAEVFGGHYEKSQAAKRETDMKAKAKKFGTRNKAVNPGRVSKMSQDAGSLEESIARALADQGY